MSRSLSYQLMLLGALVVLGALFLLLVGDAALAGTSNLQFFADSGTYMRVAAGGFGDIHSLRAIIGFSANYLGPLLILKLAQQNVYAVLLINVAIYGISVHLLARATNADDIGLHMLLLANPVTLSSLLAVNKEIISLLTIAVLLSGLHRRHWPSLLCAIVLGMLVRWQFAIFCILTCVIFSRLNFLKHRRLAVLAILLAFASLAIWLLNPFIASVRGFNLELQGYHGSGLFDRMIAAQQNGLYWLIFVPKALHLMFGLGLRLDRLFNPSNLYNDVWQLLYSTTMIGIVGALAVRRQIRLRHDLVFITVIYLIVFVLTPIYVPRYLYPVYVMLCALLTSSEQQAGVKPALPSSTSKAIGI